jgi:hypothetical protein
MTDSGRRHHFTTRAQAAFRGGSAKRLAGAAVVAVLALVALIVLGPDEESIKRRFEYYGAPDELRIMPEISIEDGADLTRQLPQSLQAPPPPAEIEVEREDPVDKADEVLPEPVEAPDDTDVQPVQVVDPAEVAENEQVQLSLPRQSNPDWYILRETRPSYPLEVSEAERRTPVVFVRAAIFVGPDGTVLEKLILGTNGSAAYSEAVLEALGEWLFGWRVEPGTGRWIEMTWNFRSPYFTPQR